MSGVWIGYAVKDDESRVVHRYYTAWNSWAEVRIGLEVYATEHRAHNHPEDDLLYELADTIPLGWSIEDNAGRWYIGAEPS